jgi:exonuclease VII small subunit
MSSNINSQENIKTKNEQALYNLTYTQAQQRLHEIEQMLAKYVQNMQIKENTGNQASLDELCILYEEAQLLLKHCANLLNDTNQRIDVATEAGFVPYS